MISYPDFCLIPDADVLIGKKIELHIVPSTATFSRTPTAHTCGFLLQIPSNYNSYIEFKTEFSNVLMYGLLEQFSLNC